MPLGVNHAGGLRRQFLAKHLMTTTVGTRQLSDKQKTNIKKHITRYRRNWDIYVEEVFQIHLYPIQKVMIHLMGISDVFFAICTRGAAKSFLVGLGALCEFTLKPYSEIVITSSTLPQAAKLVEKKIRDELIKKLSPYLLYMYEHEYIVITKSNTSDGGYTVENKLNGSTITVLPCLDSARGSRSTWNIYEEARLLKKSLIDSVFEPMGHSRPAVYLQKKEYQTKRWLEKARSTYITSARFKFEWFFRKYKDVVTDYYLSEHETYIPFAEDIFAAIEDGTRTWADYRKAKRQMGEIDFRCEILNEMIGEAEDAFFNFQMCKEAQILQQAFIPPTPIDIYTQKDLGNRKKGNDEIRIIIVDYAFANTTSKDKNDNTIIIAMSGIWEKNKFKRKIEYIEGHEASDSVGAMRRAKELFWDYQADYLIPDSRSGGEVLFNLLTEPMGNPQRGNAWDKRGFTICDNFNYHVVPDAKLLDYRHRTVDPNALPCIIPIIGNAELNSACWIDLKKQLESHNIEFLISMQDRQTILEDNGKYFKLTTEELVEELLPYGQTDESIQELVNLKTEIKLDKIRLYEPRSGTKDRAVVIAYGNYILSKIENEWAKQSQQEEINIDDIQLIW